MFSKASSSWISLATVTPSCVTVGAPNFLSRATLRPFGPRVVLTASARISVPRLSDARASSRNCSCFAGIRKCPPYLPNYRENVRVLQQEMVDAFDRDFGTGVLGVQHDLFRPNF